MTDEAPDSLIPYDEIVQEALRAVVGRVLGQIVVTGGHLPAGLMETVTMHLRPDADGGQ